MVDLGDVEILRAKIKSFMAAGYGVMLAEGGEGYVVPEMLAEEFYAHGRALASFVGETSVWLADQLAHGARVLFEGAQGAMLDLDHGTYPFVTSSSSTAGGFAPGLGIGPKWLDGTIGVFKAYCTRVGAGPFPTEQADEVGNLIRDRGHEYGTTTGRPRRCGWFDAVAVKRAVRISGATMLAVTKLDVLTGLERIAVCVGYQIDGAPVSGFPLADLGRVTPVYETLPGWREPLTQVRAVEDLPANARRYVDRLAALVGCPLGLLSVGPGREQTIVLDNPFKR